MFGMGLTTKLIIAGVAAGLLTAAGYGLWRHYQGLHDEIAQLQLNSQAWETAYGAEKTKADAMQSQWESSERRAADARTKLLAAQAKVDYLEGLLEKHDLKMLVKRQPGLMTRRFQNGTDAVHKEIEEAANEVLK